VDRSKVTRATAAGIATVAAVWLTAIAQKRTADYPIVAAPASAFVPGSFSNRLRSVRPPINGVTPSERDESTATGSTSDFEKNNLNNGDSSAGDPSTDDPRDDGLTDEESLAVDMNGNEVMPAMATYKVDNTGSLYELHSPHTEVPRLGTPKS
jgi:hypothetical protein